MKLEKENLRVSTSALFMVVLVLVSFGACSTAGEIELLEAPRGPAIPLEKLEGNIGDEWNDAARTVFPVPYGLAEVYIKCDDDYLYLAFDIGDRTKENEDDIQISFDTLHNGGMSFDQHDDRKFNISRSGQIFGQHTWDGAVAERSRGWQVETRVSLPSLNNPPPGSTVGFQIALRDYTYTGLVDAWPQGSDPRRPDTWGDLVLKEESGVPSVHDKPPTVSISVSPKMVRLGETFQVLLKAEDDVGLQSMWWWGESTGIPDLDKAHEARIFGKSATSQWRITATKEGTFTLAANARDSAYPTPGEPHQASEGDGIARATISVVSEASGPQPPTTVHLIPGAPSPVKYTATLGQKILVQGERFAPETTYRFKWARFPCGGEVTTNLQGNFQGEITLPSIVPVGHPREQWLLCYDKQDRRTTTIARQKLTIE